MEAFERLVEEAERRPFSGWDFSFLEGRHEECKFSWDLRGMILERLGHAGSLLDLGTGGGEFLSSLQPLPRTTCVTEGYPPNASIAKRRLEALGVEVVQTYCEDNGGPSKQKGALPFRSGTFDVLIDRHEAYIATEVHRVLKPHGIFITQQVGDENNAELRTFLQGEDWRTVPSSWNLKKAVAELEAAGFEPEDQRAETRKSFFLDIGAVVYYLKAVPWEVPGFSTKKYDKKLREMDMKIRTTGFLEVTTSRFYVVAMKR